MSKKTAQEVKSTNEHDLKMMEKCSYPSDYEASIIEQWKTCVDAANGVSEKRNTANSIFITVNTAVIAVITSSSSGRSILLAIVGIFICFLWTRLIENYRILNKVKYDIINEIEAMLPLSPFKTEWYRLHEHKNYTGLTKIEKALPIVFVLLYALMALYYIMKFLLPFICPCISS